MGSIWYSKREGVVEGVEGVEGVLGAASLEEYEKRGLSWAGASFTLISGGNVSLMAERANCFLNGETVTTRAVERAREVRRENMRSERGMREGRRLGSVLVFLGQLYLSIELEFV